MKLVLIAVVSAVSLLLASGSAEACNRNCSYTFERELPLEQCQTIWEVFTKENLLTMEKFGENDFYLNDTDGNRVGNAYYSVGTCYIYLD